MDHCLDHSSQVFQRQSSNNVAITVYNVLLVLLTSLCISSYKSSQVFLTLSRLSFLIERQYSITIIYHYLFNHSPVFGHSLNFQFLATTKRAVLNIFVHLSPFLILMIFLGCRPRSDIAGSKGVHIFIAPYAQFHITLQNSLICSQLHDALVFQFSHIISNINHFPVLSCQPI